MAAILTNDRHFDFLSSQSIKFDQNTIGINYLNFDTCITICTILPCDKAFSWKLATVLYFWAASQQDFIRIPIRSVIPISVIESR